jgi:hypothetical protein
MSLFTSTKEKGQEFTEDEERTRVVKRKSVTETIVIDEEDDKGILNAMPIEDTSGSCSSSIGNSS